MRANLYLGRGMGTLFLFLGGNFQQVGGLASPP
jgi:hypothetical protein